MKLILTCLLFVVSSVEGRIIDGFYASKLPETSFNVYISIANRSTCSGSLIAPRFILTAAHCVQGLSKDDVILTMGSDVQVYPKIVSSLPEVKKIIIHPGFDGPSHDIALIELSSAVKDKRPVTLYTGEIEREKIFSVEVYGYSTFTWSDSEDLLSHIRNIETFNMPRNLDDAGVTRLQK